MTLVSRIAKPTRTNSSTTLVSRINLIDVAEISRTAAPGDPGLTETLPSATGLRKRGNREKLIIALKSAALRVITTAAFVRNHALDRKISVTLHDSLKRLQNRLSRSLPKFTGHSARPTALANWAIAGPTPRRSSPCWIHFEALTEFQRR